MSIDSMIINHYSLDEEFIKFELLEKAVIDSTAMQIVEAITIEPQTNDFVEGFKIFYNEAYEPLFGRYWRLSLVPNKTKRHFIERQLTPMELEQVVEWKNNFLVKKSFISEENIL